MDADAKDSSQVGHAHAADAHAHAADAHVAQVNAARRAVLAVPERDLAALVVTGRDRGAWLNGLLTCDVLKCPEGDACYGLVVVRSGRMMVDVIVVRLPEKTLLVVPTSLRGAVRDHLDHYLVMEDAEIAPDVAFDVWTLHGPRSADVLRAARDAGALGGAIDRTGLGGAVLLLPSERAEPLRAAVAAAVGVAGGVVGDPGGWEALRLERGVPRFGVDFDDKMYPQEAALEKVAVSFDKGCYLGQEVVCMLEMRGHVKRKLVPVVLEDAAPGTDGGLTRGAPVTDESGGALGEVTSFAASPTLGKAVALAMVKRSHAEPGCTVVVAGRRAEVVQRPA
jgi:folate-binding protein YgfZ